MKAGWELYLTATGRPSAIVGGRGTLELAAERAAWLGDQKRRCYLLTDSNVDEAWGEAVRGRLGPCLQGSVVLEPGEPTKSLAVAGRVFEILAEAGARRDDVVVALGGGVIGDLAGFVAATYQRGVDFWQIPTSLVAQVDSSVGGKVGLNLAAGKNLVGAFYQPDHVFIDSNLLSTLPREELVNGLGEVVKYGLLVGEELLGQIERSAKALLAADPNSLDTLIRECVEYKALVVEADEREAGRRAVLNLGHTTAHALELLDGYEGISHGRAVALGLLVALSASEEVFGLDADVRERVAGLLAALELPVKLPGIESAAVLEAAGRDKKVSSQGRGFVLLRGPGHPVTGVDLTDDQFAAALEKVMA
ncbi:MAG: 3-dehydroquinate synthase [Thermoleophilia bacterium]